MEFPRIQFESPTRQSRMRLEYSRKMALQSFMELQIFVFFYFISFEKGRLLYIHPVGQLVSQSTSPLNFSIYRGIKALFLTKYLLISNSNKLHLPSITKYQPVLPHTDPVPPNTSEYRPILAQYHHISMSLNVPCNNVPRNKFSRDNCSSLKCPSQQCPSRQLFLATIVPCDNCSPRQLFLSTIVPRNNYSSVPLEMVSYKEDGPPDDQNQGNGGAQIVANDHPDDPASSVLLCFFANGHL